MVQNGLLKITAPHNYISGSQDSSPVHDLVAMFDNTHSYAGIVNPNCL